MPPHYVYGSFQSSANYTSTKLTNLTSVLLNNPMDCSLPGSFVHEISQARMLEWVACPPPGDPPDPGIKPRSLALQADSLLSESLGKPN